MFLLLYFFRAHSIHKGFICKVLQGISMALFNIGFEYSRIAPRGSLLLNFLRYDKVRKQESRFIWNKFDNLRLTSTCRTCR